MLPSFLSVHAQGVTLRLRVQPRASRTAVVGPHGDALKVAVTAPPVDAAANEAVIALMADTLRVPKSAVTIVHGHASRSKVVHVAGVTADAAARALTPPAAG